MHPSNKDRPSILFRIRTLLTLLMLIATTWPSSLASAQSPAPPPDTSPAPTEVTAATASFDHSLALDGNGDYLEVPHDPALNLSAADGYTLEAWVRRAADTGCQTIVSKDFLSAYYLGLCDGEIRYWSGGSRATDGTTVVPPDVWTHVAVVWEQGAEYTYYINGELEGSGSAGPAPANNGYALFIGADPGSAASLYELEGNLSEVRLWSVARAPDDIRRTMHVALEEPRPGLVAAWHLSDDYRDSVGGHDGSPRGNPGLSGPQAPPRPARVPGDVYFNRLETPRSGAATAYIPSQDQGVLIGGWSDGVRSDRIELIEASTGLTTTLGTLPSARSYPAAAYVPGTDTTYVFGGDDASSGFSWSVAAIDHADGTVQPVLYALFTPLVSQAAAVYHPALDKIYLFGGLQDGSDLSSIDLFNPATESFEPLDLQLPQARRGMAAIYSHVTGDVYLFGGRNGGSSTDEVYRVSLSSDGTSGSVTELTTAKLPHVSYGMAAVEDPNTGLIYLLGGGFMDRVLAFDPVTERLWRTPLEIKEERTFPSALYSPQNRHALLIGGNLGATHGDNVWRFPLGDGPAVPLGHWDFPQALTDPVTAIHGDDDKVGVGTSSDGLWLFDAFLDPEHFSAGELDGSGRVNDLFYEPLDKRLWVATNQAGGKRIDDDGFIGSYGSATLGTDQVLSVDVERLSSSDRSPFFGTDEGLKWRDGSGAWRTNFVDPVSALAHRAPGEVWALVNEFLGDLIYTRYHAAEGQHDQYVCNLQQPTDIAFGPNDYIWLTAEPYLLDGNPVTQGGVCRVPADDLSQDQRFEPLIGSVLAFGAVAKGVDVDAEGRIWVALDSQSNGGGASGGLVAYESVESNASTPALRTEEFNWLDGPLGSRTPIQDTHWDSGFTAVGAADERVWAGKPDGRLVTLAQRWQQLDESNRLEDKLIRHVWTARGRAFFATDESLHVLLPDGQTWENWNDLTVYAVMDDRQGRIWVGTDAGVRLYTPGGLETLDDAVGSAPNGDVYALAEDQRGRVWIGGEDGLTLYDRERFVFTLDARNSRLPGGSVQALLVDRADRLWVGTSAGLARLDGSAWTEFTTADGLPSEDVRDLAQLGDGRIAASTFRPEGFFGVGELALYDGSDFTPQELPAESLNAPPLTVDELGRLWAGGALLTSDGWQGYYRTNSGLRNSYVGDNAADGADRVWFSHGPVAGGASVRGALLPPLADVQPTVDDVSPARGSSGDEITIHGSGFGDAPERVHVVVGGVGAEIVSLSDDRIRVRLQDDTRSGDVLVSVDGRRVALRGSPDQPTFCAVPVVDSFTPTGANNGVDVEIHGTNFDRGANIYLGDGDAHRDRRSATDPTRLRVRVNADDASGPVKVVNACGDEGSSAGEFRHYSPDITAMDLNQGLPIYPLMSHKPTLIQNYLSTGEALRADDCLEVDEVQVSFEHGLAPEPITYSQPRTPACLDFGVVGEPSEAQLRDIDNSFNVWLTPQVEELFIPAEAATVDVQVTLRRRNQTVVQTTERFWFWRDFTMRVLLVPIMRPGYDDTADLDPLKTNFDDNLDQLAQRIWPTGRVEFEWAAPVIQDDPVNLSNFFHLYDVSHAMDRARRRWNRNQNPNLLIAFGVVEEELISGGTPHAFWPDLTEMINMMGLNEIDQLCDIGNALVRVFTLGQLGSEDGCHLEIPLYVGWGNEDMNANRVSSTVGHEMGHTMGLVKPYAWNGFVDFPGVSDNYSHSLTDELENGTCNDAGTTYSTDKTLYEQLGVREPVVDPVSQTQFRSQLTLQDDGDPADEDTHRGKAIMSYACDDLNDNVFFEPVDLLGIFIEFGLSSLRNFVHDLAPAIGPTPTAAGRPSPALAADAPPTPRPVAGQRIYVSGTVNKDADAGEIRRVEVLGEEAPLDASYHSGYWLVQRDAAGDELARSGLFPVFTTSETGPDNDVGFFAATLLLEQGVAQVALRHEETTLDTFTAGGAAPSVSVNSPNGGTYAGGTIPVTWTASDPDGDPLEIVVDYSADGGATWSTQAFAEDSGTVEVPVGQLAGSSDARFRVSASDGFHGASATSGSFSVAYQPPRPHVGSPTAGSDLLEGRRVWLRGGARDNQDGRVAGENLRWRSDRDGDLGSGAELNVLLSVGTHTLTLEAENSAGLTATASVAVTVVSDYDYDGIPDAAELADGLSPLTGKDAYSDADGDSLPLIVERKRGTDPNDPDSDGDGRADGREVADGTDPAADDAPLPPDELAVSPQHLTLEADLALDATLPQQGLQVLSREPTTWTLTSDVDWLAASAANGQTPAGPTVLADAYALEDGTHTGNLVFAADALGSAVTVPVTLTVTNSAAHFDTNDDGGVNIGDVQGVAGRVPSDNGQAGFDYRRDVDRDGDVDLEDVAWIGGRWVTDHACCPTPYPVAPSPVEIVAPDTLTPGETVTVAVRAQSVTDLGGFEFQLAFDPALLQFQGAALGDLLGNGGRTAEALDPITDVSGRVVFGGYSRGSQPGAAGDGTLARLTFQVVGTGDAGLLLNNALLADPDGAVSVSISTPLAPEWRLYLPAVLR